MGLGECDYCGGRLNGVEHSNGQLGPYSFSQACDACQNAAWQAFRMARDSAIGDRATAWFKNGGLAPVGPAASAPPVLTPPPLAAPAPKPPTAPTGGNAQ